MGLSSVWRRACGCTTRRRARTEISGWSGHVVYFGCIADMIHSKQHDIGDSTKGFNSPMASPCAEAMDSPNLHKQLGVRTKSTYRRPDATTACWRRSPLETLGPSHELADRCL